jgi:hypothetical protein
MRTRAQICLLLTTVVAGLVVVGCGEDKAPPAAPQVVHGQSSGRLPDETLVDWVSYADGVAVVTVASEKEIPLQIGDVNVAGEGLQGRTLTLKVDRLLWSRPEARPVPNEFPMRAPGWALKNFVKQPFTSGSVRLEVGSKYLMAIAWIYDGGWSQLGSETAALIGPEGRPVAEGRVTNPAVSGFIGKPLDEAAAALRATSPDPRAARHFDLDAIRRWDAVLKELGSSVTG